MPRYLPLALLLLCAGLAASGVDAHTDRRCTEVRCFDTAQKIRQLEKNLRRRHTNAQGRRYRDRLEQLRDWQREFCR